ncbi:hypothetical protein ND748_27950 [Frankia sp. AiPs1]|uniref:hypothetical protein n=1 Tax=Frankia sp. AiPs1 TaxID=573493 RepID=UPI002043C292|nr:hypothetical protein [Frankia sp. AiPs1]MCM3925488.1 hypothetical protein [Frankia sp. AiPs1]
MAASAGRADLHLDPARPKKSQDNFIVDIILGIIVFQVPRNIDADFPARYLFT